MHGRARVWLHAPGSRLTASLSFTDKENHFLLFTPPQSQLSDLRFYQSGLTELWRLFKHNKPSCAGTHCHPSRDQIHRGCEGDLSYPRRAQSIAHIWSVVFKQGLENRKTFVFLNGKNARLGCVCVVHHAVWTGKEQSWPCEEQCSFSRFPFAANDIVSVGCGNVSTCSTRGSSARSEFQALMHCTWLFWVLEHHYVFSPGIDGSFKYRISTDKFCLLWKSRTVGTFSNFKNIPNDILMPLAKNCKKDTILSVGWEEILRRLMFLSFLPLHFCHRILMFACFGVAPRLHPTDPTVYLW